jgi:outer membrane protein OmpA-like peptidoglycan-associated protein
VQRHRGGWRYYVAGPLAGAVLFVARTAGATEFEARIEPAFATPLSSPQSNRFGAGGGGWLGAAVHALPYIDWQATAAWLALSAGNDGSATGEAFAIGTGPRIQRPRKEGWSPWIDGDAMYVRTGPLDRFGAAVGLGVAFPLGEAKTLWLGPFARYLQIVGADGAGLDSRDARILTAGLALEGLTPSPAPTPRPEAPNPDLDGDGVPNADDRCPTTAGPAENGGCPDVDTDGDTVVDRLDACPQQPGPAENHGCPWPDRDGDGVVDRDDRCPDAPGPPELKGCPDRDKDGVVDVDDQCPDVPGTVENHGCPEYKLVKVTEEKVEIKQRIFFAFGTATVLPKSFPLLEEVAKALEDHAALQVRIEGHTDSVGSAANNLKLSQGRADAVKRFLIEHGVAADRLTAVGYGMTMPLESNATVEGREHNRRVEFVITGGQTKSDAQPGAPPQAPPPSEPASKGVP